MPSELELGLIARVAALEERVAALEKKVANLARQPAEAPRRAEKKKEARGDEQA